ncbi:MAG TPA: hypothetical protein VN782_07805 [Usitatibacter sp.]|nr:hypothetical protein [Usitatibacter sp.]
MAEAREAVVHEAATLSLRGIGAGVGVIVCGIAIAIGVPALIVAGVQAPANAPDDASHPKIRPPVQELTPEDDMAAFRREKMRRLESYGIDPRTGRAHIPIERAMRMLVERSKSPDAVKPQRNHR